MAAYRSQPDDEARFRQMNDPKVISCSSMHHWIDQKNRVPCRGAVRGAWLGAWVGGVLRGVSIPPALHLRIARWKAPADPLEGTTWRRC